MASYCSELYIWCAVLLSGGGTALDPGWPSTRLAVETGTTSGQSEVPSVRPLQHSYCTTRNKCNSAYIGAYSDLVNLSSEKIIWSRGWSGWVWVWWWWWWTGYLWWLCCKVSSILAWPLPPPPPPPLAPQHRHNTNVTLLLQLDNIKLYINYTNSASF